MQVNIRNSKYLTAILYTGYKVGDYTDQMMSFVQAQVLGSIRKSQDGMVL